MSAVALLMAACATLRAALAPNVGPQTVAVGLTYYGFKQLRNTPDLAPVEVAQK